MPNNTGTLSERISVLLEAADQLRVEIKKLRIEIDQREGIESINHLADVPGGLHDAENDMRSVAALLCIAMQEATLGGE